MCSTADAPNISTCLEQQSQGDGLTAQSALFELGQLRGRDGRAEDAVSAFRASLPRFPGGVLEPEVRLALLVQLTRSRRFDEARAVAAQFEERFPEDPRRADVQQVTRALKWMR